MELRESSIGRKDKADYVDTLSPDSTGHPNSSNRGRSQKA